MRLENECGLVFRPANIKEAKHQAEYDVLIERLLRETVSSKNLCLRSGWEDSNLQIRQTLLDIVPRSGHEYVGSAIFGIHMPVWSVFIAMGLLLGFAVRLALFGGLRSAPEKDGSTIRRLTQGVTLYVVAICGVNFISVVAQCGIGDCHTFGYRLLP
jgi:hypothetical protein